MSIFGSPTRHRVGVATDRQHLRCRSTGYRPLQRNSVICVSLVSPVLPNAARFVRKAFLVVEMLGRSSSGSARSGLITGMRQVAQRMRQGPGKCAPSGAVLRRAGWRSRRSGRFQGQRAEPISLWHSAMSTTAVAQLHLHNWPKPAPLAAISLAGRVSSRSVGRRDVRRSGSR